MSCTSFISIDRHSLIHSSQNVSDKPYVHHGGVTNETKLLSYVTNHGAQPIYDPELFYE